MKIKPRVTHREKKAGGTQMRNQKMFTFTVYSQSFDLAAMNWTTQVWKWREKTTEWGKHLLKSNVFILSLFITAYHYGNSAP